MSAIINDIKQVVHLPLSWGCVGMREVAEKEGGVCMQGYPSPGAAGGGRSTSHLPLHSSHPLHQSGCEGEGHPLIITLHINNKGLLFTLN